jgi:hypothetical protein
LGGAKAFGPQVDLEPLQGKIVHGGKLDGNQEESKKEKTLTAAQRISHGPEVSTRLSRGAPLEGLSHSAAINYAANGSNKCP